MADWDALSDEAKEMLERIQRKTDAGEAASMWGVGEELGMDRATTEDVAMGLAGEGLLEIKSLSGAVALTEAGSKLAGSFGRGAPLGDASPTLDGFIEAAERLLPSLSLDPGIWKDLEIDLKTLRLQSKRSTPLPEVVRAALEAIGKGLEKADGPEAGSLLDSLSSLI